jgi:hypothetical protein
VVPIARTAGLNIRHIPPRSGRSAGINRGLEQVRTRFVAVTDDDCFVDINWLSAWQIACIRTSRRLSPGESIRQVKEMSISCCHIASSRIYDRPQLKVHPLIGGNMGASMDLVKRIGLFDEHQSVQSAEDSDWGYRALLLGIPIVYDPNIVVNHYSWRNAHQRASRYQEYARSQGGFYGKYLIRGDRFILMQQPAYCEARSAGWRLVRKDQDMIDRGRANTLSSYQVCWLAPAWRDS